MFLKKKKDKGFILNFKLFSIFYYKFKNNDKIFYKKLIFKGKDRATGYNFIYKKRGIGIVVPKS